MFRIFIILVVVVPALEIWFLIKVGQWIGGWQTLLLLLLSGFLGAFLAKREFREVWKYFRFEVSRGHFPTKAILDGICVFAGGIFLLTPGFITDVIGFLLVMPFTRPVFRAVIENWIRRHIWYRRII